MPPNNGGQIHPRWADASPVRRVCPLCVLRHYVSISAAVRLMLRGRFRQQFLLPLLCHGFSLTRKTHFDSREGAETVSMVSLYSKRVPRRLCALCAAGNGIQENPNTQKSTPREGNLPKRTKKAEGFDAFRLTNAPRYGILLS